MGELSAFTKQETQVIKQFLSKTEDIYRAAYGRRTDKYLRRCVFFGTSNDSEFLKDMTGNRRFWPVDVGVNPAKRSVWKELPQEVDQIWAEAYAYWAAGEELYMPKELEAAAVEQQETHREASGKEGLIMDFLNKPVPISWNQMDLVKRRMFLSGGMHVEEKLVLRDKICAVEIWTECFGGDLKYMKRSDSMEINNILLHGKWQRIKTPRDFGPYGPQRGFTRPAT